MNDGLLSYLLDGDNWQFGATGSIPSLILTHLWYTIQAVAVAAAIALPLGLYIGHTGKLSFIAINAANAGRSLPTLGLIILLVVLMGRGFLPVLIALVILAIPPILTTTYAGIRAVDPAAIDAAKGMGMRPMQVLFKLEVPMALPLISSGLRNALLQVIATSTVAAYVGIGGLGRLLVDGIALNAYERVVAGAVVVAALAIVVDLIAAVIQRSVISPGLTGRRVTRRTTKTVPAPSTSPAPTGQPGPGTRTKAPTS
ncbi:ABC transporter permease [Frigoribacterium sp. CFBP9039]|uniref:ABC transporter permease n=1 Tax=Frigoribacterium TaxID=96492 RepID=UPI0017855611|nr:MULTISPECIES: ABC transporter permease [Frigoribacterium]MBD8704641.1 ABC transporter permease [Frigoribacterium sp. CFBP 13712]MCJ0700933.1 ABC transporter permease [Frigoribacterium faeni]MDY0946886.1 ABC transporter permease [Frigoribacterium sp. CFBP9039]